MESEQANRPQWTGHGFEIWFFVVLVPGSERALWVRLTRFCDGGASDARIWAVVSEGKDVTAQREILPLERMSTEAADKSFHLRVGESELRRGFSAGRCGRIAWELSFEPGDAAVARVPKLPGFVPLGTRATHPHAEAPVRGWVELDGRRLALDGGLLTQMHLWGHKRVEWLRWAWVPRFDQDGQLELTAVAPEAGGAGLCALWARIGDQVFDNTGLLKAARAKVSTVRPGVLHHVGAHGAHRLVVRTFAAAPSFAGWDYRQIGGGDLHVAQSNLARCELELFRKVGLGWQPERRLRSTCAALELHGPEDFPELAYVAWDSREPRPRERRAAPSEPTPRPPSEPGRWIDTPAPEKIVALGLTYREHVAETSSAPEKPGLTLAEQLAQNGVQLLERRDFAHAQPLLERARKLCAKDKRSATCAELAINLSFHLGRAYEAQGQLAEAMAEFERVIKAPSAGRDKARAAQQQVAQEAVLRLVPKLGVVVIKRRAGSACQQTSRWMPPGSHRIEVDGEQQEVSVQATQTVQVGSCP